MGGKRDLVDTLATVGLFSRCTKRELRAIARHSQLASLPAGTELIHQGDPGDALFVVLEGEVQVLDGEVVIHESGPGSYFGELAILDGEPRTASVTATTDVTIAVIGIRMFRTLLREFPDLAEQLLVGLAAELRAARAGAATPTGA